MRGRTVFVAGGGNSAGQAALHLAKWAEKVTVLVRAQSLADTMSDYLIRQIGAAPNIDVCYRVQVAGGTGTGTGHLESLVLQDTASGTRRSAPADALFVLIGSQPRTQMARPGRRTRPAGVHPHRPGPARRHPLAPRPPAAAAGDQPARGVRRR
jgi:thioredoxin reductase